MSDVFVLVCGLPGSGNRLVREILHRSGVAAEVWHGYPSDGGVRRAERLMMLAGDPEDVRVVVVLRGAEEQQAAAKRHFGDRSPHIGVEDVEAAEVVSRYIRERDLDWMEVEYENLIHNPTAIATALQLWAGGTPTPFPTEPDPRGKEFGPIIKGNTDE